MLLNHHLFLDNLWRWKCGIKELADFPKEKVNLDQLKETEWSPEFESLMRNRLLMGSFRYGKLSDSDKPQYDRVLSIFRRLQKYRETQNKEFLVDVANLCLVEFVEGQGYFDSIDDGEHVTLI